MMMERKIERPSTQWLKEYLEGLGHMPDLITIECSDRFYQSWMNIKGLMDILKSMKGFEAIDFRIVRENSCDGWRAI